MKLKMVIASLVSLLLGCLMCYYATSQTPTSEVYFFQVKETRGGIYNKAEKQWIYLQWKPCTTTLGFIMQGDTVKVTDIARSRYRLLKSDKFIRTDSSDIRIWKAVDEQGRPCLFTIEMTDDGKAIFIITYENYKTFQYRILTEENSRL
jgi:hypothetical protein